MMHTIDFDDELLQIFKAIVDRKLTQEQWRAIESCDEFQSEHYCGGYDATEDAFCFSHFSPDNKEYWFQVSSTEIEDVVKGNRIAIHLRLAE